MKNVLQIVNDMIKIDDIILLLNYLDLKVKLHCYLNSPVMTNERLYSLSNKQHSRCYG